MEFRQMVTITLYVREQMRHRCIEQSFGLCGRGRGWDDLGEWHWNTYNIIYGTSRQSRFDARYWMLGAGALGWPRGMVWGGRREEGSGWGTHVYLWQIHFDIWQNQYNIVKFKNKIFKKSAVSWFWNKMIPKIAVVLRLHWIHLTVWFKSLMLTICYVPINFIYHQESSLQTPILIQNVWVWFLRWQ